MITKEFKGKRGFVIGGGPSIKTLMEQGLDISKLLTQEITIGTNKSYTLGKSTYHVVMDSSYYLTDMENLNKQNLLVSDTIWNKFPDLKVLKRINNQIISDSFEEGIYYGKSSGYIALNIANVLGLNPIYLLGIDLNGLHFHEGYGKNKDLKLPKEHKIIERELRRGILELQSKGVSIISLSKTSLLNDIIPYDSSILKEFGWGGYSNMYNVIGEYWADPNIDDKLDEAGLELDHKYRKRREWIDVKKDLISKYLPEYEECRSKNVLDFSIGNGAFLEVMRYLGHSIHGTDHPTCKYIPFHESQEIPVSYFNATNQPYPFPDKSFDLVTSVSAMTFYKCDWGEVLDEFFRIAKETVFVIVNLGEIWDTKKHMIEEYTPPKGWRLVVSVRSTFKWVYEGA